MTDPQAPGRREISVVIPAYNEEDRLAPTVERIRSYLDENGWDFEIIVVDDGSADGTVGVAERAAAADSRIRVVRNDRNRGKGYTVRNGMLNAGRALRLFSDADLSTPIEELEKLLPWVDQGCDIVIGSRDVAGSNLERPQSFFRESSGKIFNMIVQLSAIRGVRDTQCGFKLFTAKAADVIFPQQKLENFAFDVEVLVLARRAGFAIREVGVRWLHMPNSRVHPLRAPLRMLAEIVKLRWNLLTGKYRR